VRNILLYVVLLVPVLHADVTLLLEEPYGTFGAMNPTGHAALYFSRICAETPILLRRCGADEEGIVISRYHRVAGRDWLAIPLIPYLYAVTDVEQVPMSVTPETAAALRDAYRRAYLESLIPDDSDGSTPRGDWTQLIGESYDRTIYAFRIETTEEQDEDLIRTLNAGPNHTSFHLIYRNCADFARRVVNTYYPGAIKRNFSSDLGIMTPKQAAKRLLLYSKKHPDLEFSISVVPQAVGTIPRSSAVRGVLESLIKSKKYVVPLGVLAMLHPAVGSGIVYSWIDGPHFDPRRLAASRGVPWPETQIAHSMPEEHRGGASTGVVGIVSPAEDAAGH